jgi:UDP:flavonoid glycosyltransferase YjiC (YdhE family)
MAASPTPLTIMVWPESAYGPTNQCIGLAAILRDRGHTIVFAAESSWAGKLTPFCFIEELVDLAQPEPAAEGGDEHPWWTAIRSVDMWQSLPRQSARTSIRPTGSTPAR